MNVKGTIEKGMVVLVIDPSVTPVISKSEAAKAEKEGRTPRASLVATTGGFVQIGDVKVSLSAIRA